MNSLLPVLCVRSVSDNQQFYESLFGLRAAFEIDWYVQLQSTDNAAIQIAFVEVNHPSVPGAYQQTPAGTVITLEVDDADSYYQRATNLGLKVVIPLRDEDFGQRHFMVEDPNGLLVDVVKLIEPSAEFQQHYQS
jgi:uncharacterized glyoxalase superfamily protein PhnB